MTDNWVSMMYEICWEEEKKEEYGDSQDLPLMKNISDWVCDLTSVNIDGFLSMECEWFIFHTSPGHITILIDLFAVDRKKRIRYPFKEPKNWEKRPIPQARWTATRIRMYDDLVIKRQELEAQKSLISKTHVKTN